MDGFFLNTELCGKNPTKILVTRIFKKKKKHFRSSQTKPDGSVTKRLRSHVRIFDQ